MLIPNKHNGYQAGARRLHIGGGGGGGGSAEPVVTPPPARLPSSPPARPPDSACARASKTVKGSRTSVCEALSTRCRCPCKGAAKTTSFCAKTSSPCPAIASASPRLRLTTMASRPWFQGTSARHSRTSPIRM